MKKTEIRKINKQKRKEMSDAEAADKSSVIQAIFLQSDKYKNAKTIMLYMPLENEVDTSEIMRVAFKNGKKIALPVTDSENRIIPYYTDINTEFKIGAYSVKEPIDESITDPKNIDVVIVPGIAFDKRGNRVGFGKGCYDGFLKDIKATKIGICYEFQLCDELKTDSFDVKMDYVVTEKGIFNTSSVTS